MIKNVSQRRSLRENRFLPHAGICFPLTTTGQNKSTLNGVWHAQQSFSLIRFSFACVDLAAQESYPSAGEVIQACIDAMGGEMQLGEIESLRMKGHSEQVSDQFPWVNQEYFWQPGRWQLTQSGPSFSKRWGGWGNQVWVLQKFVVCCKSAIFCIGFQLGNIAPKWPPIPERILFECSIAMTLQNNKANAVCPNRSLGYWSLALPSLRLCNQTAWMEKERHKFKIVVVSTNESYRGNQICLFC